MQKAATRCYLPAEAPAGPPFRFSRAAHAVKMLAKRRCRQMWHRTGRCSTNNRTRSDALMREKRTVFDPHRGQTIVSPTSAKVDKLFHLGDGSEKGRTKSWICECGEVLPRPV